MSRQPSSRNKRAGILFLSVILLLTAAQTPLRAAVAVPNLFSSNMVLQRDKPVPVWGTADPDETVTVEFAGQKLETKADAKGVWSVTLEPMSVSTENRTMTIRGKDNAIALENVLVGDVWLCSGQSNMEMSFSWGIKDRIPMEDVKKYPTIRAIKFMKSYSAEPLTEVKAGKWVICSESTLSGVTACGYFFALEIAKQTDIPIGLLDDNWSGCRIEPFIPLEGFEQVPALNSFVQKIRGSDPSTPEGQQNWNDYLKKMEVWLEESKKCVAEKQYPSAGPGKAPLLNTVNDPASQYNSMIAPIVRFPIKGAIWYQGCSNAGDASQAYFEKMQALVKGWRTKWGYDFPFYFVQLASYQKPTETPEGGDGFARAREGQRLSLQIPGTGMAVAIDIGEAGDIHPKNKYDVGRRLALWALAKDYGKKDLVCSGPLYRESRIEGNRIRLFFDSIGSGLTAGEKNGTEPMKECPGAKLTGFAIAGKNRKWFWADAVIDGSEILVSSPEVPEPLYVRYAYRGNPMGACNLYNKEGLPASPFRTDPQ